LVSFLFESGCRAGELLSIQLKNLTFDEFGCLVTLTGKTGMRKIRVVASVPQLSLWLENHPSKGDKEAPLWAPKNNRKRKKTINYPHINGLLKNLAKKSGVTKRVNPHNFRHSRATQMANHLTEAQMDNYFGWVQGSKMPSVYVHLSGRDMDNAILKMNGIKVDENKKPTHFAPKVCFRCEKKNPPTGDICVRCGAPLNVKAAMEAEEKKKRRDKTLAVLLRDPETRQFLYNKMQNIKEIEWYQSAEKSDSTGAVPGDFL
jgi:ribosomal protein L40E